MKVCRLALPGSADHMTLMGGAVEVGRAADKAVQAGQVVR